MLYAERLKSDPRVKKAMDLLLEALQSESQEIKEIIPPDPEKKLEYAALIESVSESRGAKLYFPFIGSSIGNGSFVELLDGSVKFDMITGIGVHFFGHSNPLFLKSNIESALSDTVMQGNLQQNSDGYALAQLLIKHSGLQHCFISTSGVMANENALKIAFQKNTPAKRILAFDHCFAGRTFTFSQVTDKPSFREGLPESIFVDYIPFYDETRKEESIFEAQKQLSLVINRYPKAHALMIFELVQGEGGFYEGSKDFFEPLMKICKEHHIAVFADEIQTFGRTPALFAFQHYGLESYVDITAVGKLSQATATLFSNEYCPKPGLLSQTFTASTSALKAGLFLIEQLLGGGFFGDSGRNAAIHNRFTTHLKKLEQENLIKGPFGIGCMIAFTPFDGSFEKTTEFIHALYADGVITFIAGASPFRVRMLVPGGVITDEQIDQVMKIIETTLIRLKAHASD